VPAGTDSKSAVTSSIVSSAAPVSSFAIHEQAVLIEDAQVVAAAAGPADGHLRAARALDAHAVAAVIVGGERHVERDVDAVAAVVLERDLLGAADGGRARTREQEVIDEVIADEVEAAWSQIGALLTGGAFTGVAALAAIAADHRDQRKTDQG
jgi:hypothetical protein